MGGALYPPENYYDLTDREIVADLAGRLRRGPAPTASLASAV